MASVADVLIGRRFGSWTVIGPRTGSRLKSVACRCECGTEQLVKIDNLGKGSTKCRRCQARSAMTGSGVSNVETEVAWAAGLFEGEGSIGWNQGRPRLTMASTDEDVLRRFHRVVGRGCVCGPYIKEIGRKPRFDWNASGWLASAEILRAFLPYLGDRRLKRAREVLRAAEERDRAA